MSEGQREVGEVEKLPGGCRKFGRSREVGLSTAGGWAGGIRKLSGGREEVGFFPSHEAREDVGHGQRKWASREEGWLRSRKCAGHRKSGEDREEDVGVEVTAGREEAMEALGSWAWRYRKFWEVRGSWRGSEEAWRAVRKWAEGQREDAEELGRRYRKLSEDVVEVVAGPAKRLPGGWKGGKAVGSCGRPRGNCGKAVREIALSCGVLQEVIGGRSGCLTARGKPGNQRKLAEGSEGKLWEGCEGVVGGPEGSCLEVALEGREAGGGRRKLWDGRKKLAEGRRIFADGRRSWVRSVGWLRSEEIVGGRRKPAKVERTRWRSEFCPGTRKFWRVGGSGLRAVVGEDVGEVRQVAPGQREVEERVWWSGERRGSCLSGCRKLAEVRGSCPRDVGSCRPRKEVAWRPWKWTEGRSCGNCAGPEALAGRSKKLAAVVRGSWLGRGSGLVDEGIGEVRRRAKVRNSRKVGKRVEAIGSMRSEGCWLRGQRTMEDRRKGLRSEEVGEGVAVKAGGRRKLLPDRQRKLHGAEEVGEVRGSCGSGCVELWGGQREVAGGRKLSRP
ncbi:hypothetical protein FNV43_RR21402 [Rhamnella rubrinervis]|uniref:Uncharacterized protein n=1 Tax=Rhamnella rubrinervis TaxID=2594499 RepID=A0A8K0GUC1_9ROSA|nr:hypothetical protein FNV43_RR21402 [Rhamnella rubrinervis]